MRRIALLTMGLAVSTLAVDVRVADASSASLRGSRAAMVEQNRVAQDHGLTFFRTEAEIRAAVERGELKRLEGNDDYAVADFVRWPYLHADAALFVERLAAQYREACGQRLVVTSGVRPTNRQPSNSHQLSVHPAGMAVDLRVSDRASCRSWLETAILNMEGRGLINGIREFRPPHYHIAVYPGPYRAWAEERMALEAEERAIEEAAAQARLEAKRGADALAAAGAHALLPVEVHEADAESPRGSRAPTAAGMVVGFLAIPFGFMLTRRRRP
jgi:hypothetical protein